MALLGSVHNTTSVVVMIRNNSSGLVVVSKVEMHDGTWCMTNSNNGDRAKLAAIPVDDHRLGLLLTAKSEALASNKDGNQFFAPSQ